MTSSSQYNTPSQYFQLSRFFLYLRPVKLNYYLKEHWVHSLKNVLLLFDFDQIFAW